MNRPTHADLPIICPICAIRISEDAAKVQVADILDYCPHTMTFVIARARFGMIAGWDLSCPLTPEMATELKNVIMADAEKNGKPRAQVRVN